MKADTHVDVQAHMDTHTMLLLDEVSRRAVCREGRMFDCLEQRCKGLNVNSIRDFTGKGKPPELDVITVQPDNFIKMQIPIPGTEGLCAVWICTTREPRHTVDVVFSPFL